MKLEMITTTTFIESIRSIRNWIFYRSIGSIRPIGNLLDQLD